MFPFISLEVGKRQISLSSWHTHCHCLSKDSSQPFPTENSVWTKIFRAANSLARIPHERHEWPTDAADARDRTNCQSQSSFLLEEFRNWTTSVMRASKSHIGATSFQFSWKEKQLFKNKILLQNASMVSWTDLSLPLLLPLPCVKTTLFFCTDFSCCPSDSSHH